MPVLDNGVVLLYLLLHPHHYLVLSWQGGLAVDGRLGSPFVLLHQFALVMQSLDLVLNLLDSVCFGQLLRKLTQSYIGQLGGGCLFMFFRLVIQRC
jgi:hypothetical protein